MKKTWLGTLIISMSLLSSLSAAESVEKPLVDKFENDHFIQYSITRGKKTCEAVFHKKSGILCGGCSEPLEIDPKTGWVDSAYWADDLHVVIARFNSLRNLYEQQEKSKE